MIRWTPDGFTWDELGLSVTAGVETQHRKRQEKESETEMNL